MHIFALNFGSQVQNHFVRSGLNNGIVPRAIVIKTVRNYHKTAVYAVGSDDAKKASF